MSVRAAWEIKDYSGNIENCSEKLKLLPTIVFAKAGMEIVTSAMYIHQQWSGEIFNVQL
jgi:hypothetical protein